MKKVVKFSEATRFEAETPEDQALLDELQKMRDEDRPTGYSFDLRYMETSPDGHWHLKPERFKIEMGLLKRIEEASEKMGHISAHEPGDLQVIPEESLPLGFRVKQDLDVLHDVAFTIDYASLPPQLRDQVQGLVDCLTERLRQTIPRMVEERCGNVVHR